MSIFMSYRRNDSADASGRIYDRLVASFGEDLVFKDVDDIPLGMDFKKHLKDVLNRCAVELVIIGPNWLEVRDPSGGRRLESPNDFVRLEVEAALNRDIPVIPLLVREASMPTEGDLPPSMASLASRQGVQIRSDPDFHRDMDRLIKGLQTYVATTGSDGKRNIQTETNGSSFFRRWWRVGLGLLSVSAFFFMALLGKSNDDFQIGAFLIALLLGIITIGYLIPRRWGHAVVYVVTTFGFISFSSNPSLLPPAGFEEYLLAAIPIFVFGPIALLWSIRDAIRKVDI